MHPEPPAAATGAEVGVGGLAGVGVAGAGAGAGLGGTGAGVGASCGATAGVGRCARRFGRFRARSGNRAGRIVGRAFAVARIHCRFQGNRLIPRLVDLRSVGFSAGLVGQIAGLAVVGGRVFRFLFLLLHSGHVAGAFILALGRECLIAAVLCVGHLVCRSARPLVGAIAFSQIGFVLCPVAPEPSPAWLVAIAGPLIVGLHLDIVATLVVLGPRPPAHNAEPTTSRSARSS
ncbi:MAG: hypothetical protein IPO66_13995 [Rhodanobacteraceae bacterium]|nr:hypothetical protein [Rhodanobacteraceae bacterium]